MPAASFSRTIEVPTPAEQCWSALTDVQTLVSWVAVLDSGKEVEPLARYEAVLMDRVGPFKLRADLTIRLTDVQAPSHVLVRAEGEDRQVGSRITVDAVLNLVAASTEGDAGTTVSVAGSYEVSGRVATLGAGTIRKKADKLLDEFFASMTRTLG
jgi:carbon monoxide dehydrogenase subunit G